MRFTHSNRHCTKHPYNNLIRCEDTETENILTNEKNTEILQWFKKYRANRDDKTTKKKKLNQCDENTQIPRLSHSIGSNPKSRKGLMCELDMNAGLGSSIASKMQTSVPKAIEWNEGEDDQENTISPMNPKKRWLRDAWQADLVRPIEPSISRQFVMEANQLRPTVLMLAKRHHAAPLDDVNNEVNETID